MEPRSQRLVTEAKIDAVVDAAVRPAVDEALAADDTVTTAAANAVSSALEAEDVVQGAVRNAVPPVGEWEVAAGFIGENGRPTDLVVDSTGAVPEQVVQEWSRRAGAPESVAKVNPSGAAGGLVGENNRETDLVVDAVGRVLDQVLSDWAVRLGPMIGTHIPELARALPSDYTTAYGTNPSRNLLVRDPEGAVIPQTSKNTQYAAWGDSLTDGHPQPDPFLADQSNAWPGVLASLLGKPVYNGGKSGQSADEIALRQGGLVMAVLPDGGVIPGTGAVTVTTEQVIGWRLDRGWSCTGTVAGVHGTLSRASSTLTFTRTTDGDPVPVSAPTPFVSAPGQDYDDATTILMLGRNDINYTGVSGADAPIERIVSANIAAVQSLTPANPRFLILGTINATGEAYTATGTGAYRQVTESNRILSELFPQNYLDIRSYIVNESIYDQGITPTETDLANISTDRPPPSIMLDGVHYTPATAATVAQRIHTWLTEKGWH